MREQRDGAVPMIGPGDTVRLVSPASFPADAWPIEASIAVLEGWGLRVEVGDHALDRWGYMAGHDDDRAADLNAALRDRRVRAIFTTAGGAGAYRIVDAIDFDAARRDPKPVVGFSDITNLHLALWRHCGSVGVHGGLAGARQQRSVRQVLMSTEPVVLQRDPAALTAGIEVPGRATGHLVGGHLTTLSGYVGTPGFRLHGAVVLLEDVRTIGLGRVDRALTQLVRSGAFAGVRGFALGRFLGYDDYEDRGWTVRDVLRERLGALGVPVLGGLDVGHGEDPVAVPLGGRVTIDVADGTLEAEPIVR